jgi:hypothetical protein
MQQKKIGLQRIRKNFQKNGKRNFARLSHQSSNQVTVLSTGDLARPIF